MMLIDSFDIARSNGWVRVSMRVREEPASGAIPERLWYEIPVEYESWVIERADAFVAALLLRAMSLRADIHLDGSISAKLLRGMSVYQSVFAAWVPRRFHEVEIHAPVILSREVDRGCAVGSAFSGGVDSAYTLRCHLKDREPDPEFRVSHGLFVHGFDIPLAREDIYQSWSAIFERSLESFGVDLIRVRTNARDFVVGLRWNFAHGPALCSVPLLLQKGLARMYIPASSPYSDLEPWGSHPVADPLLSSDSLDIVHHGCMARVTKIAKIADWPPVDDWLRVCWEHPEVSRNCCRCMNCLMTMVGLELAGALSRSVTFPESLDLRRIRDLQIPEGEQGECLAALARSVEMGRTDIAAELRTALSRSRLRARTNYLRRRLLGMATRARRRVLG